MIRDGDLIRTTVYLEREYDLSFRGEDLLHWMIGHSWAEDRKEAAAISQLLLTHNVILNGRKRSSPLSLSQFMIECPSQPVS